MRQQAWVRAAATAAAALLVVLSSAASAAGTGVGVITIVEGDAMLVRGDERFAATEGLKLRSEDIVGTADGARLLRIEFDDGKVVDLGPGTQVLLQPRAIGGERAAALYVAQGWVKLSSAKNPAPAALASARLDAQRITGNTILRIGRGDELWLFAESGSVDAVRRREGRSLPPQPLKEGDSFVQRGSASIGGISRLPPADLLGQLPRAFVDTLPRRAARFGEGVEPTRPVDVSYADVALWVNGEAPLRAAFVPRLTQRAKDNRFRGALVAELKLHPEWQRVLFPPPPPPPPPPKPVPPVGPVATLAPDTAASAAE